MTINRLRIIYWNIRLWVWAAAKSEYFNQFRLVIIGVSLRTQIPYAAIREFCELNRTSPSLESTVFF